MRIPLEHCYSSRTVRSLTAEILPPSVTSRRRYVTTTVGARGVSFSNSRDKDRGDVVVLLGATGTGKSMLSVDLGTRFRAEVINSDKMQVYRGLDITTNKLSVSDRGGVPHHLLGELDPKEGVLSPAAFCSLASERIAAIQERQRVPIVAGGSNSFVHALLAADYKPGHDPFKSTLSARGKIHAEDVKTSPFLRYRCCLLWVDVGWEVLEEYLDRRVDEMVGLGMVQELATHYSPRRAEEDRYQGLEAAIGVPELDRYFRKYPPEHGQLGRLGTDRSGGLRLKTEREAYELAVEEIKENTRVLARRQLEKIETLRVGMGWEMLRVDATETVQRKLDGRTRVDVKESWKRDVLRPAVAEVASFLGSRLHEPTRRSGPAFRMYA